MPGCLGLIGYDRDFLADQAVKERGFAGIRASDDCDGAAFHVFTVTRLLAEDLLALSMLQGSQGHIEEAMRDGELGLLIQGHHVAGSGQDMNCGRILAKDSARDVIGYNQSPGSCGAF